MSGEAVIDRQSLRSAPTNGGDAEITAFDSVGNEVLMMSRGSRRLVRRGIACLHAMDRHRFVVVLMVRMMVACMMRFSEIVWDGRAQGTVHARQQKDHQS